ncbi:MAG: DEAD/DEAH box helicase [Aestuariibacter sp.]
MTFESLSLCKPLLSALKQNGYTTPSEIQAKAIPAVLSGQDVMAAAQTGTGKTAAFTLPLLHNLSSKERKVRANRVRALVLTPTRELAAQVADNVAKYGKELRLNYNVVFGGVKINPQMMKLRRGTDVLIATPGRLLDLYQQNAVKFDDLEVLVLDEADRMLDMGFIHDIKKILALLPKKRQNLLFSATFSNEIRTLAKRFVHNPVEVSVAAANTTVDRIAQSVHPVDKNKKTKLLVHLVSSENWYQVLVFCRTKHGANRLTTDLNKRDISASAIHGNKSQNVRTKALADFKQNKIQVLVATDIAARGIDIAELPHVVNFDLPNVAEDYVHRIGRTGRAGKSGKAISFVCHAENDQLKSIERFINLKIPKEIIPGFEPGHAIPASETKTKANPATKARRPKKVRKAAHSHSGPAKRNTGDNPWKANNRSEQR